MKTPCRQSGWLWGIIIYLLSLSCSLVYFYQLRSTVYFENLMLDPEYYWIWGSRIASGQILGGDKAFEMSPLYPYLLGLYQWLFGPNLFLIRLIQVFLTAFTPVLTYLLGKKLINQRAGVLAGLITALYKTFLLYNNMIMKSWLSPLFYVAAVLLLTTGSASAYHFLGAGAVWGLLCLVRGNNLIIIPLILLWIAWRYRSAWYKNGILFLFGFILIIAPVTIRNYLVDYEFILITVGGGEVFYLGTLPQVDGEYQTPSFVRANPFTEHENFRKEAKKRTGNPNLSHRESCQFWYRQGFNNILAMPLVYLKTLVGKYLLFWNNYEVPDNHNIYLLRNFIPLFNWPLFTFGMLAPLGILGLGWEISQERKTTLLALMIGGACLSVFPFYVNARFRLGIVPLLAVGAGYALNQFYLQIKNKSYRTLGISLIILLGIWSFCNYPLKINKKAALATAQVNVGILYLHTNQPLIALDYFMDAVRSNRNNAKAHKMLHSFETNKKIIRYFKGGYQKVQRIYAEVARIFLVAARNEMSQGHYQMATVKFRVVLSYQEDNVDAILGIAEAFYRMGKHQRARSYLKKAAKLKPDDINVKILFNAYFKAVPH